MTALPLKPYNPEGKLHTGTSYFLKYIINRVKNNNQNFVCPIIGQTGSGKSWSALSFMELLNPDMDVKKNVCFKARTFMERLNDGTVVKMTVILWDETGVDLNAKEWQNLINKVIGKVMQTFRHQNLIVFFTVPFLSFISSDVRKLIHGYMRTKKVDKNTNESVLKPYLTQVNEETGKVYRKYLRVTVPGKGVMPIKSIRLPKPSKELIDWYEGEKKKFTTDLNKSVLDQIIQYEEKNKIVIKQDKPQLTNKQAAVLELYTKHKNIEKVGEMLGISFQTVSLTLKEITKKLNIEDNGLGIRIFRDFSTENAPLLSNLPTTPKTEAKNEQVITQNTD